VVLDCAAKRVKQSNATALASKQTRLTSLRVAGRILWDKLLDFLPGLSFDTVA